jgi:hypothetical protein
MEATMRFANVIGGFVFLVGFLVLCLTVLLSRPLQPIPVRRAVPVNPRRQISR